MDAFIGEIRAFGFPFAPRDWALCNGQSMNVSQFSALYAVIGNYYGGNTQAFNLPNLQGRAAIDQGTGPGLTERKVGQTPGASDVTLGIGDLPAHSHSVKVVTSNAGNDTADMANPAGAYWACGWKPGPRGTVALNTYLAPGTAKTSANMAAGTIQSSGGSASHTNMQPYQVLNMCICLNGYFPVRP